MEQPKGENNQFKIFCFSLPIKRKRERERETEGEWEQPKLSSNSHLCKEAKLTKHPCTNYI